MGERPAQMYMVCLLKQETKPAMKTSKITKTNL